MIEKSGERLSKALDDVLGRAKKRAAAANALALMFPKADDVLRTYVPSEHSGPLDKQSRRISQSDYASNYFRLDPEPLSWSKQDFDRIVRSPEEAFDLLESRLQLAPQAKKNDVARTFFELLGRHFSVHLISELWFSAILDNGARVVRILPARGDLLSLSMIDHISILLTTALQRLTQEEAIVVLSVVFPKLADVSIACEMFRSVSGDLHPDGSTDRSGENRLGYTIEEARPMLLERVRQIAALNLMWSQVEPALVLWFWWGCNLQQEVLEFTGGAQRSKEGALALMKASIRTVASSRGNYERVDIRAWSKIVDIEQLLRTANEIIAKHDGAADGEIAFRFVAAVERNKASPFA